MGALFTYIEPIGLPFCCGDQGELDAIKGISLAGSVIMVGLFLINSREFNADTVANANEGSVDEEILGKTPFWGLAVTKLQKLISKRKI